MPRIRELRADPMEPSSSQGTGDEQLARFVNQVIVPLLVQRRLRELRTSAKPEPQALILTQTEMRGEYGLQ